MAGYNPETAREIGGHAAVHMPWRPIQRAPRNRHRQVMIQRKLTHTEKQAIERAAELVGNKAAEGERTAAAYLKRRFPRHDLWRACHLLREAQRYAKREGLLDGQGRRPGAR